MRTVRRSSVFAVLVFAGMLAMPLGLLPSHGVLTGVVCIASSDSTDCPQSAPALSGATRTSFSVAVNIQGSDYFNCFDVIVTSDARVLNPVSIDLSNTIIPANVLFVVARSTRIVNSVGYAEVAACGLGFQTTPPTTGTLFQINYQVTGSVSNSTQIDFMQAQIVNPANLPETLQNATFTVQGPQPDFLMTSLASTLIFPRGESTSTTIQLASVNGFSGNIAVSATSSDPGISISLSVPVVSLLPETVANVTLVVNGTLSTPPGDYLTTVTASNGTLSHSIDFVVQVADFALLNFSSSTLKITIHTTPTSPLRGTPLFSTRLVMFLENVLGFSKTISIKATVAPSVARGPVLVLSASSIDISENGSYVFLNVTATNSTPTGTYTVTVTATSGQLVHSITVPLIISRSP